MLCSTVAAWCWQVLHSSTLLCLQAVKLEAPNYVGKDEVPTSLLRPGIDDPDRCAAPQLAHGSLQRKTPQALFMFGLGSGRVCSAQHLYCSLPCNAVKPPAPPSLSPALKLLLLCPNPGPAACAASLSA